MTRLKPGLLLKGQYRLDRAIGEGAMGAVYQAHDERSGGGTWALKIINEADLAPSEVAEAVALFRREADISARLRHPGLPEVVDFFSENGLHVLVMARIHGETLDARMERWGRPMSEQELVPLLVQLCACLCYLHQQQPNPIVFRDLKPSNCMVTASGQLRLIDFGIARYYKPGRKSDTLVIGTPGFCAPEQYGHGQTEPRSDLYSLGATAWHLLTGLDPASVGFSFPPLRQVAPRASAAVEAIVARCVAFAPEGRYPSAVELLADLRWVAAQAAPPCSGRAPIALPPGVHRTQRMAHASSRRLQPLPLTPSSCGPAFTAVRPALDASPTPSRLGACLERHLVASWARRTFLSGRDPASVHAARALSMLFVTMVLASLAHLVFAPPNPHVMSHASHAPRVGVDACVATLEALREPLEAWQAAHRRYPSPGEAGVLDARPCPVTRAPYVYRVATDGRRYVLQCAGHPTGPRPRLDSWSRRVTFTEETP